MLYQKNSGEEISKQDEIRQDKTTQDNTRGCRVFIALVAFWFRFPLLIAIGAEYSIRSKDFGSWSTARQGSRSGGDDVVQLYCYAGLRAISCDDSFNGIYNRNWVLYADNICDQDYCSSCEIAGKAALVLVIGQFLIGSIMDLYIFYYRIRVDSFGKKYSAVAVTFLGACFGATALANWQTYCVPKRMLKVL
jgi:hypothetical protein